MNETDDERADTSVDLAGLGTFWRWCPACIIAVNLSCLIWLVSPHWLSAGSNKITVSPVEIEFPRLTVGTKSVATVQLGNNGPRQIGISRVKTSCGCTAASVDSKSILPGGTTTVTVEVNPKLSTTAGEIGIVFVEFESDEVQAIAIPIAAKRVHGYVLTPGYLDLGLIARAELPTERIVYATSSASAPADSISLSAEATCAGVAVSRGQPIGTRHPFTVRFGESVRSGKLSCDIEFAAFVDGHERLPGQSIRVTGFIGDK